MRTFREKKENETRSSTTIFLRERKHKTGVPLISYVNTINSNVWSTNTKTFQGNFVRVEVKKKKSTKK